ncbi:glycoside hydrolase domain-containing protein [Roseateles amylovorans]|uniref:DUF1906 domain-containing protein n=1 Tax=Roseateles amylovorans TaxID=2978473 RepID=A0ABY6ASZ4_9BURK|nr:glycoside hydrolase domain-containing protein [Roseateles amylovorans]UXH76137.1 DUF1906 domain-containing protein [Roseateles amylovorans]
MTYFAGIDTDQFPGLAALSWLKTQTPLAWCAYYLAPAPSHGDRSWCGQRAALLAQGWGVLPVFLGQQTVGPGSHQVNGPQGAVDGKLAVQLAQKEGFSAGATVILDWEDGSAPSPSALDYMRTWMLTVSAGGYQPGLYCSHVLAPSLVAAVAPNPPLPPPPVWAWRVSETAPHPFAGDLRQLDPIDPGHCGYPDAAIWQFEQNATLSLPGTPCDGLCVDLSWSLESQP